MYRDQVLKLMVIVWSLAVLPMGLIMKASVAAPILSNNLDKEYNHDATVINRLRQSGDLSTLKATADPLLAKWLALDKQKYAALTCDVCIILSSRNFHDQKQFSIVEQYAFSALNTVHSIPIQTQAGLVMYGLSHITRSTNGQDQITTATRRSMYAREWFITWQKINSLIDPHFDPHALRVEANVLPPVDSGQLMFPGMSPHAIHDSKIRAEYERSIALNNEKIEYLDKQIALRQLHRTFSHVAENYLVQAYSQAPYDVDELKGYIAQYPADTAVESDILKRVAANIGAL